MEYLEIIIGLIWKLVAWTGLIIIGQIIEQEYPNTFWTLTLAVVLFWLWTLLEIASWIYKKGMKDASKLSGSGTAKKEDVKYVVDKDSP